MLLMVLRYFPYFNRTEKNMRATRSMDRKTRASGRSSDNSSTTDNRRRSGHRLSPGPSKKPRMNAIHVQATSAPKANSVQNNGQAGNTTTATSASNTNSVQNNGQAGNTGTATNTAMATNKESDVHTTKAL